MINKTTNLSASILLVDDQVTNIHVISSILEGIAEIYFATNGQDAIEIARHCLPDVVLLDIEMPEMDGFDVCQKLKNDPIFNDTAVIFVTSHEQEVSELKALALGAVDFITKPINSRILLARVKSHLALARKNKLLIQAQRDLSDLIGTLPVFISYWNQSLNNGFCNDLVGSWFGCSAEQMQDKNLSELFDQEAVNLLMPFIKQVLAKQNQSFEFNFLANNTIVYSQASLVFRKNQGDEGFLMILTDVSDRKKTEMALYAEKERIRVTLNSIGDGVIATDPQGLVTFINPIAENLTGWQSCHAIGKEIEQVMPLLNGGLNSIAQNPLRVALKEQRTVGMSVDTVLTCTDGRIIDVEDSAAPILNDSGLTIGAVIVFHDVSEARAMAIKMTHLAQHDALTNLPNRILLRDRTEQALKKARRYSRKVALILLDIDHFKRINDTHSHIVGDNLLQQVAHFLSKYIREYDSLCRQGGDEFFILLSDVDHEYQISDLCKRIIEGFEKNWQVNDLLFNLTVSIGISVFPNDSDNMDSMYRHADVAMYTAKRQGRNCFQFFSQDIETNLKNKFILESEIRIAVEKKQFEVFYQPKVDGNTLRIVGAEALIRWRKPSGEIISPYEFIALAEETGLIVPLGDFVLRTSLLQAKLWQQQGYALKISVNISPVQFNETLVSRLKSLLESTQVNANLIELEITENLLVDSETVTDILVAIKTLGFTFALDDFGTGYSSLSYIKHFPVDVIKIDQSFVKNLLSDDVDVSIVKAIVQMATGLKLSLVAEGVETAEHAKILLQQGCHIFQGYYYSKPLEISDMNTLLTRGLPQELHSFVKG